MASIRNEYTPVTYGNSAILVVDYSVPAPFHRDKPFQTFTATGTYDVTKIKLYALGEGYTLDELSARVGIQTTVDHKPTGTWVCYDDFNCNILPDYYVSGASDFEFIMSGLLTAGVEYAIVVEFFGESATLRQFFWGKSSGVSAPGYHGIEADGVFYTYPGVPSGGSYLYEVWGSVPVPSKPTNPSPADTATDVVLGTDEVTWDDGGGADDYDVWFGPTGGMTLRESGQAGTTWSIPAEVLFYETGYEWRIDANNIYGTTTGDTWTFDTIVFAPPVPSGEAPGAGGELGGEGGQNNMVTVKRIVAAANNTVFFQDG